MWVGDGSKMRRHGGEETICLSVLTACVCVGSQMKGELFFVRLWSGRAMELNCLMNLR